MTEESSQAVLRQPIGFWTGEAHQQVGAKLRRTLADNNLSQPQWWMLNHLDSESWSRDALLDRLAPYNTNEEGRDLATELDRLLDRGLVSTGCSGDGLAITSDGIEVLTVSRRLNGAANHAMLAGVSDDDLVTCINVLRVIVRNLGGDDSLR
ncbi:MAG: MarR family winged helix-turn-helix transcriptional regulator [Pseudonocardiaceae bacterium]